MNASSTPAVRSKGKNIPMDVQDVTPLRNPALSVVEEAEDQETERSKRRSLASADALLSESKHYSKATIMPHLEICMQLYSKNKIDAKNVWGFRIIDFMSSMVKDDTFDVDTFKMATSTMEVGVKVFSLRVDCVHTQTMDLASNMMRNAILDSADEGGADGGDPEAADGQKRPREARVRQKRVHKVLPGDEPSLEEDIHSMIEPLKQVLSTDFQQDTSDGTNFLTFSAPMAFDTQFKFMSSEKYFTDYEDLHSFDAEAFSSNIAIDLPPYEEHEMCQHFENYDITDFDPNNPPDKVDHSVVDERGQPIPELDGSFCDPFSAPAVDDLDEEEDVVPQVGQAHVEFVTDAVVPETCRSDDSFSLVGSSEEGRQFMVNLWAGPGHWKVKFVKHRRATFTGSVQHKEAAAKQRRRRAKRDEAVEVILREDVELPPVVLLGVRSKKLRKSRFQVPIQLVPDNLRPKELLRGRYIVLAKDGGKQGGGAEEAPQLAENDAAAEEYNYENANDSLYCADAGDDHLDDDDAPLAGDVDNVYDEADVDLPDIAPKAEIGYTKAANKINMKKLKTAIWDIVSDSNGAEKEDDDSAALISEKHFAEVYKSLTKKINGIMQESLSVPLAFSALLHLANEKGLNLVSSSDLSDIHITPK